MSALKDEHEIAADKNAANVVMGIIWLHEKTGLSFRLLEELIAEDKDLSDGFHSVPNF